MTDETEQDDRPARQADITNHERRITRLETGEQHQNAEIAALQVTIKTELSGIKKGISDLQRWQGRAFTVAGGIGAAIVAAAVPLLQHFFGG